MITGVVTSITQDWRGDALTVAASSSDTVLTLGNAGDFEEFEETPDGPCYLVVNDETTPREYIAADMEANTVTLAAAVGGSGLEVDTPVILWDPSVGEAGDRVVEYVASVRLHDDSGTAPAVVPHELIPASGVFGLVGASVSIDEDDEGNWYVARVLGREPVQDGTYIDATTIPDPVATDPPTSSPEVTLSGFAGGIVARAETVAASTQIEYHVWDDSTGDETYTPTQGDTDTLLDTTRSAVEVIEKLPDGTPLAEGTSYYVATWAKNSAGYAVTASATVSGQIDMDAVRSIAVAEMVAGVVFSGRYETGSSSWSADEGLVFRDENGLPFITLPADGTQSAEILAFIRATGITVEDNANFYGLAQEFGTFRLTNGISDPAIEATLSRTWGSLAAAFAPGFEDTVVGLTAAIGGGWASASSLLGVGSGRVVDSSGAFFASVPFPSKFAPDGGIAVIGTTYYVLGKDNGRGGDWYVYKFNSSFTKTGEFAVSFGGSTARPVIGTDGTNVLIAKTSSDGDVITVRDFSTSGSLLATVNCTHNLGVQYDLGGLFRGSADFGATRIVIAPRGRSPLVFNSTGTRQTSHEFARAGGSQVNGLHWDGTRFRHLDDAGKIWDYETSHVSDSTVYGAYTWYDGDTSSGSTAHETAKSDAKSFAWPARSRLVIAGQPAPDVLVTDPSKRDKANLVRIWAGTSSGTLRLQAGGGTGSALPLGTSSLSITTLDTGSTTSTASSFSGATATPGNIESAAQNGSGVPHTDIKGDGSVRMVKFGQAGSATVTVTSPSTFGTQAVVFSEPFAAAPHVTGNSENSNWNVACGSITASGFTITVRHIDANTAGGTPVVHWIAMAG